MKTTVRLKDNRDGFTLVELMIALVVFAIIAVGMSTVYINLTKTWEAEEIKASMQQSARVAMDNMVREMMMMGYGSDTKILTARQGHIRFEESIEDPDNPGNFLNKRMRYYLDSGKLKRGVVDAAPPTDTDSETVTLIENVDSLVFEYYNNYGVMKDYTSLQPDWVSGSTPAAVATQLADSVGEPQYERDQIRRVKVTLVVRSARPMPGTDDYKEITLKADLSPRNLWEGELSMDQDPPMFGNNSTAAGWLKVRDTGRCGYLQAQWQKSSSADCEGYLVKYGTADGIWTDYVDVPAGDSEADPTATLDSIQVSYFTEPAVNYFVNVQAYDAHGNYSDMMDNSAVGADPYPNITSFAGDTNDSSNNIPKPAAPAGLGAFNSDPDGDSHDAECPDDAVMLRWTPSTDPNVTGYRIYRNDAPFASFPIAEDYMIARETDPSGDAWTGPRTDKGGSSGGDGQEWTYADGMFIDKDEGLIGCETYYYAICAVTCDTTRINGFGDEGLDTARGGIYAEAEYATVSGSPNESVPPNAPGIWARAGWKRVFLQMDWPSGPGNEDYRYTEIYFKRNAAGPTDLPDITGDDPYVGKLIIDRQTGYDRGTFFNFGTAAQNTVIFNNDGLTDVGDVDLGDTALPRLDNDINYSFVAVSYDQCGNALAEADFATTYADLCGDDPCGRPLWSATPSVWVDANNTNLDASTWDPGNALGNTQIDVGFRWTDVVKDDPATALDFYGFNVSSDVSPSGPFSDSIAVGEWNSYVESTGLVEGASYSYRVQATDCVWQNITEADTVECVETGVTYDYGQIKANNITPLDEAPGLDNIRPGKFRQYVHPSNPSSMYNLCYTTNQFHSNPIFYLQNTSASPMVIESMAVDWDNPDTFLAGVLFGATALQGAQYYTAGVGPKTYFTVGREMLDVATGPGSASPVTQTTLVFANMDGTVSELTDMRGDTIKWEIKFKNLSMPANEAHSSFVGGFTTGDINDPARVRKLNVSVGPVVNSVVHDRPDNPTEAMNVTQNSLPALIHNVDGLVDVTVTANITKPSNETIKHAYLCVYKTAPTATTVSGVTPSWIKMVPTGNDYRATIPGVSDKGVWYYIWVVSDQGTTLRHPLRNAQYYYYKQLPFDICTATPEPPDTWGWYDTWSNIVNLNWWYPEVWEEDPVTHIWEAKTYYEGDIPHDELTDPFTFNVYKKAEGEPGYTKIVSGTADTFAQITGLTVTTQFYVTTQNTCADPGPVESDPSTLFMACISAAAPCRPEIQSNPDVSLWNYYGEDPPWYGWGSSELSFTICALANDSVWTELDVDFVSEEATGTIKAWEDGDSGIFRQWVNFTSDPWYVTNPDGWSVVPATSLDNPDDHVTFSVPAYGCADLVVDVHTDPCSNTPSATTIVAGTRDASNNVVLRVNKITTNTDGSPAASDTDSVNYRVWYYDATSGTPTPVRMNPLGVVDNGDGTITLSGALAVSGSQGNNDFGFYVVAADSCTSPQANLSAQSNTVTIAKKGSYP